MKIFTKLLTRNYLLVFFLAGLFLFFSEDCSASHFRGGNLSWQQAGGNKIKFTLNCSWRRGFFSTNSVGTVLNLTTTNQDYFYFGDGTRGNITATVVTSDATTDIITTTSVIEHTYASTGNYIVNVFNNCCRLNNTIVQDGNSNTNYNFQTVVNVGGTSLNNSPVTSLSALVNISTGQQFATFTIPASDPDGNILSYRLSTIGLPSTNYPTGASTDISKESGLTTAAPSLNWSLNSSTGVVTIDTRNKMVGNVYYVQVMISDGKTKTPCDFLIKIVAFSAPPAFSSPTISSYIVSPGNTLSFVVSASDPDAGQSVTLNQVALPTGSNMAPLLPVTGAVNGTVSSTFTWTPTSSQSGTYVLNFVAQDDVGVQAFKAITITVPCALNFTSAITNAHCAGESNGSASVTVSDFSSTANLSYQWTGPNNFTATTKDISGVPAGTYTLKVSDAATGCLRTNTVVIGTDVTLSVTASSNTPVNAGGSLNLTASGATSYSWKGPDLFASSSENPSIGNAVITNAGSYTVTGTTNGCTASATTDVVVNKAIATITVTGYTGVYDAAAHSAVGIAKGVNGEDLSSSLSLGSSFMNVPGGTANWTFNNPNYVAQIGSADIVINKAPVTLAFGNMTYTYDGTAKSATATATPDVSGVSVTGTGTDAGAYASSASLSNPNYEAISISGDLKINPASATVNVNGYTGVYDAASHGATGTATGVNGIDLASSLSLGSSFTNAPGGTASWSFSNPNYVTQSNTASIVINKANATIAVTPYSVTYDGAAHTATGNAKGVTGETLSGLSITSTHTDAGTYATDSYSFTDATGNYNDVAATTISDKINPASATVNVNGYTGVYDAASHGATGTATGVNGIDLTSSLSLGSSFTNAPGGTASWSFSNPNYVTQSNTASIVINKANATIAVTPYSVTYDGAAHTATGNAKGVTGETLSGLSITSTHTDAGTYATDSYSFTDATGNYNDVAATTISDKINPASATVNVNGYTGVYDAASHGATGTATGVNGIDLTSSLSLGSSFTNAPGGTASWSFSNPNYVTQSNTASIVINKANATIAVTPYSVTYDGAAHTATGNAKGVTGETLSGLSITSTHTDAGTYATDSYSFTDATGNYNDVAATTISDKINPASATVNVNGYTGVYDAASHGATGTATGVNGIDLASSLSLGSSFTNAPGGTASWSFSNPNYVAQSNTASIVINKANATIAVTPYSVTYDGAAHTATGNAKGVTGETLSGLSITSTHTDAGTYATDSYSFTDATGNYNDVAATTISDKINPASATVNVNGYTGVYDAASHGATGTATGVNGIDLASSLSLGSSFTNAPGGTASWSFSNPNYVAQKGSMAIVINKANQTIDWSNPTAVCNGAILSNTQLKAVVKGVTGGSSIGTVTYSPPAGQALTTNGSNQLSVNVASTTNYNAAAKFVTIQVNALPAPSIAVSRTDNTFTGLDAKTIALGYGAQQLTLTASNSASSLTATTYKWSPASGLSSTNTATSVFKPTAAGTFVFMVTATNELGCSASTTVTITVVDVRCGSANDKVIVCHKTGSSGNPTNELCISANAVATHLGHGDNVGSCLAAIVSSTMKIATPTASAQGEIKGIEIVKELTVLATPNPTTNVFKLQVTSNDQNTPATIRVVDAFGRSLNQFDKVAIGSTVTFGEGYLNGYYFAQVFQGTQRKVVKLVKAK